MKRTMNWVVPVLAAVACGQDDLVAPEQPVSDVLAESENALRADPLVALLLGSLKDPTAVDAVRVAMARLSEEPQATNSALLAEDVARVGSLVEELASGDTTGGAMDGEADDLVALAALGLLLEHAREGNATASPGEGRFDLSGVRRPRR